MIAFLGMRCRWSRGARLRGMDVGGVRAPLVDPTPQDEADLAELIETGLSLVKGE